jgi:RNA polymerase sigma-70 factor (ECF subfamily)
VEATDWRPDVVDIAVEFSAFYRTHFGRVYRAAWMVSGDEAAADEATQEAFSRAFARWRRLREHDWAIGWVITTALNVAKKQSRMVRRQLGTDVIDRATPGSSAAATLDLRRALAELPRRQRHALVLFYIGDLPVRAVAEAMNISEGAVKAHLAHGRTALRTRLEDRDE